MTENTNTIDARGLRCPEPIMLLHTGLYNVAAGQHIELLADDSNTATDLRKLCHYLGHQIIATHHHACYTTFVIQKRVAAQ